MPQVSMILSPEAIKRREGTVVKQLTFQFLMEQWQKLPVALDPKNKEKLIAHMSNAIIAVFKKGRGKTDGNDPSLVK